MKVFCLYDELVPVSSLKEHPRNSNDHSEEQIAQLAKILEFQGWRYPIKVSKRTGFITSGHGRLYAAKKNGWDVVPVNFQDYETDDQESADVISDNSIASWAELNLAKINSQIGDFAPDFDINLLGIENFKLDAAEKLGLVDEDEVPESAPPITVLGDLYRLGDHRLLCGDSTNIQHVERIMNGEKASVWLSDPPYGINHVEVSQEKGQSKGYDKIENDDLTDQAFQDFIFSCITASLPFMKDNFAFYMWHAMKMQGYTAAAAAAAGILFHRQIIWEKPQFVFGRGHYHWKHELCLMGWLKGNEPPFYGPRNQDTIWKVGRENDKIHPTQKPVAIWYPSIENHTKQGEVIYEPFSGSGSNLIACEKLSRKCFGLELSPRYCDVIVERWTKFTGKEAYRVNEDGTESAWSELVKSDPSAIA